MLPVPEGRHGPTLRHDMPLAKRQAQIATSKKIKVRTGCITCKIRKVKCDEQKPACKRCKDTGRKCDGYLDLDKTGKIQQHISIVSRQKQVWRLQSHLVPGVDAVLLPDAYPAIERQLLLHFSQRAGPALSGIADQHFWSQILPQIASSEPAIRHALLAVGASHAHFEAGSSTGHIAHLVKPDFTIKQYNLAIEQLQQSTNRPDSAEVALICCLLFICLECLYGNRLLVLDHLRNGMNILQTAISRSRHLGILLTTMDNLQDIFQRLDAQSTLYGKPALSVLHELDPTPALMRPASFSNIAEARNSLKLLLSLSLNFIQSKYDWSMPGDTSRPTYVFRQRLQERHLAWTNGVDELERKLPAESKLRRSILPLRIQHRASFVFLSNSLEIEETCYDSFFPDFRTILYWVRELSQTAAASRTPDSSPSVSMPHIPLASSPVFTLDAHIIPSLYLTVIKCRHPVIRRQALALLEANNGREGLWDAKLHGRVARRIIEIEEGNMWASRGLAECMTQLDLDPSKQTLTDSSDAIAIPDESCRVRRADVEEFVEKRPRSAQVVFFTAPNGVQAPWKIWTEEILI